jgi:hypothetical protein
MVSIFFSAMNVITGRGAHTSHSRPRDLKKCEGKFFFFLVQVRNWTTSLKFLAECEHQGVFGKNKLVSTEILPPKIQQETAICIEISDIT